MKQSYDIESFVGQLIKLAIIDKYGLDGYTGSSSWVINLPDNWIDYYIREEAGPDDIILFTVTT